MSSAESAWAWVSGVPSDLKTCTNKSGRPASKATKIFRRSSFRDIAASATASRVETPTRGSDAASPNPWAAAIPIRIPVKLPGPTVTPIRSRSLKSVAVSAMTSWIMGTRISEWPRSICWERCPRIAPSRQIAAEQAPIAVSNAKTIMTPPLRRSQIPAAPTRRLGIQDPAC